MTNKDFTNKVNDIITYLNDAYDALYIFQKYTAERLNTVDDEDVSDTLQEIVDEVDDMLEKLQDDYNDTLIELKNNKKS